LLVLNLPMIGMWVQLLKLPYNILFPLIILFTIIGVYCSSNNVFDVYVMIAFGVVGYFMRKLGYEPAPLVLAFVLGPMLENNLRKSLILSQGDLLTFVERPISAACLALAVVLLVGPLLPALRKKRELVALDEGAQQLLPSPPRALARGGEGSGVGCLSARTTASEFAEAPPTPN